MAKHVTYAGAVEAEGAAQSYVDADAAYMDFDAGGGYAQFGAKGNGAVSRGVKLRTFLAGVATTVLTFVAAGAATFAFALAAAGITSTSGLTVSSGASSFGGNVTAATDNSYDFGASGANRFRDLFLARNATIGGTINGQTISSAASLTGTLSVTSTINGQTISSAANFTGSVTVATNIGISDGKLTVKRTGNVPVQVYGYSTIGGARDGSGEIQLGQSAGVGARWAYDDSSQTCVYFDNLYDGASSAIKVRLRTNGTPVTAWTFDGNGTSTSGGSLLFSTDNALDIGGGAANRPRDVNVGRNITAGGIIHATTYVEVDGTSAVPKFVMNITGTNFGLLQADSTGTWSLAYGTSATALGTPVLKWNDSGIVTLSTSAASNPFLVLDDNSGGATSHKSVRFSRAGSEVGSVSVTDAATAFNTSSDRRLKNDLGLAKSLDVLLGLEIHDFEWKVNRQKSRGVFAQDAYHVAPFMIHVGGEKLDDRGRPLDPWAADYSKLVPDLVVGWQNHERRLKALE